MSAPLPDRLNRLFDVMHRASEPVISNAAAAEGISHRSGVSISHDDLRQLRAGTKRDATPEQLSAIAEFFGVPACYLTDPNGDPVIEAQLNLLHAMRDNGVRDLHSCGAARSASEPLPPQAINSVAEMITRVFS
ncbi:XRE family transcriptional regulator [Candidatus Mycobacterium methanotrophicum]|uniref:XRE family transcriptional regulator n=1 Tax=Candidatus Mycobacterium methanotrophicum TaxID=2943498 RepID=A0ABY4QS19_9MYCO|nr:XRE family transcriptional regulator [Candidatus Mycobacterium methanotrophicum]UQX13466.1 XRE family transcriptional regulator [Candidatus Mycobacterium methanotrophicum]